MSWCSHIPAISTGMVHLCSLWSHSPANQPLLVHAGAVRVPREGESMDGLLRSGLRSGVTLFPPQFIAQSKLQGSLDSRGGERDSTFDVRSYESMSLRGKHRWNDRNCVNICNLQAYFSFTWHDHYFHLVTLFNLKLTLGLRLTEIPGSFAVKEENWTRLSMTINILAQEGHTSLLLTINCLINCLSCGYLSCGDQ